MSQNIKTPEEILNDLEKLSPLDMPNYLLQCEFYDKNDAIQALEKAEEQFKNNGGVAGSMLDTLMYSTADAVGLCLVRYIHEGTYRSLIRTRTTDFTACIKNALNFEYEKNFLSEQSTAVNDSLKQDYLRRGIVRNSADGRERKLDVGEKGYQGGKNYRANGMNESFKNRQSADGKTVQDTSGKTLFLNEKDANGNRSLVAEADHIIPLETIHNSHKYFIERYVDLDETDKHGRNQLQLIVNDDKNFQLLAGNKNASKGGNQTNLQYIQTCDKVHQASELYKKMEGASPEEKRALQQQISELGLSDTRRKHARQMADGSISEQDKSKYDLTEKEREQLKENHEKAKKSLAGKFFAAGAKTVLWEQVGRVIKLMIGPIGYELRDSIKNGITHGFENCNAFEAFCKRLWRAIKYTVTKLKDILVDLVTDFAKMVSALFSCACKMLVKIFGKFMDLAMSCFSVIIESVKILVSDSNQVSPAQKGDAILKLVVGFVSGILGNYAIDFLLESCGIPDPFADIVAAISSAVIGGLVMQIYTKLDIFGMQKELRRQRIEEFFKLRREALADAGASLDMVVSQQLKIRRKNLESIKSKLSQAIDNHDFKMMDDAAAQVCEFFNIEVPYNTPEEFLKFLEKNNYKIIIV